MQSFQIKTAVLLGLLAFRVDDLYADIIAPASVSTMTGQPVNVIIADGDEEVKITSGPEHGSLTNHQNGWVTYVPDTGFSGTDSFVFAALLPGVPVEGVGKVQILVSADNYPNEAQSIVTIIDSDSPELQQFYKNLTESGLSPEQQALIVQSITPLQTANQLNSSIIQMNRFTSQAAARIQTLRGGGQGRGQRQKQGVQVSLNGKHWNLASPNMASAGDDESAIDLFGGRLGFYVNGEYSEGDRVNTQLEVGSESENFSFAVGSDFWITDQWVAGAAFGFGESDNRYNRDAGSLLNRAYSGTLYTTYNVTENFYLDGVMTFTGNEYESSRNLLIPDENGDVSSVSAHSNHWGDQQRFSLGVGYSLPIDGWTFCVRGRAEYGRVNIDAYREKGDSDLNLQVEEQFNDTVLTVLGADLSYSYSSSIGVFVPQINLDWEHEFKNDSRDISMRYVNDPTSPFLIKTNSPDRDYLNFRAGVSAIFAHGLSAFVQYETLLENRYDTLHTGRMGIRWDF